MPNTVQTRFFHEKKFAVRRPRILIHAYEWLAGGGAKPTICVDSKFASRWTEDIKDSGHKIQLATPADLLRQKALPPLILLDDLPHDSVRALVEHLDALHIGSDVEYCPAVIDGVSTVDYSRPAPPVVHWSRVSHAQAAGRQLRAVKKH